MSVGTYWPWERTATLRSGLCRRGRLGGARRFGAHRGRRGAGAYCDGRPPTACYIVFFSHKILIVRTVEICIFKVIHTYVQYVSQFKYLNHIIAISLDGKNVKTFVPIIFMRRFSIKKNSTLSSYATSFTYIIYMFLWPTMSNCGK